jgi:hypothetical protein
VAASLGVVVFSTPAFILPLIAIALVYWFIGLLYVTTSRELKRMDVSHSLPDLQHFPPHLLPPAFLLHPHDPIFHLIHNAHD